MPGVIVVADTSPLNYLILLGHSDVLPTLYGRLLVPGAVLVEMSHPDAPPAVRAWAQAPPTWLERVQVQSVDNSLAAGLGPGEREAISLAVDLGADLLLIDERVGRSEAESREITVAGTLVILLQAGLLGCLDFRVQMERLRGLGFRSSRSLEAVMLKRYERERQQVGRSQGKRDL